MKFGISVAGMRPVLSLFLNMALAWASAAPQTACRLRERFRLNGMYRKGDVVFGGLFEVHFLTVFPELLFTSKPEQPRCERLDFPGFQAAQTMVFAIEEINKNPDLLPNITLGYHLYDNCVKLGVSFRAATALVSGTEESLSDLGCTGPPPVLGIVGDPGSTHSIAISSVLGLFRVPMVLYDKEGFATAQPYALNHTMMVSYYATCSCLSDRQQYPSFFRTIPSDAFQVRAMVQILERYGWKWVGILFSNDDYGVHGAQYFHQEVSRFGCVAFSEMLPQDNDRAEVQRIVGIIRRSTARVVVAFSPQPYLLPLTEEIALQNLTGRQWIASEAWATAAVFHTKELLPFLGGALGIAIHRGDIPGLQDFLLSLRPDFDPANNIVNMFWEEMFNCKFNADSPGRVCTGQESLEGTESAYSDVSAPRSSYNVYKAVYALAHALHDLLGCTPGTGPFPGNSCAELHSLQPWQLVHYLQRVNFTTSFSEQISFDKNGDALAIYDVMNWQRAADGTIKAVTVGVFDESAPPGLKLVLEEEKIFWNSESNKNLLTDQNFHQPLHSVCSEPCPPGTRRAIRKGEPVCCFDCLPCADGEISNQTDSTECYRCPVDFWSNQLRDHCVPKEIEFLSFWEPLGIVLTTISVLGACICAVTLSVFAHHRNTPVVKANNSELSFLLLLSLALCFLCSLLFIGQPQLWTCQLRHAAFGISFALSISCILVKTIVVVMAFKAARPGGNTIKWFGVQQQRGTVLAFTIIQAVICVAWLTAASPVPYKNTRTQNSKIIYQCAVGSIAGFSALLIYIGILAVISFLLAFLARNLPDNFNEAKFITFSMLIFCAVWIAFIPAYVSSPGKYSDAVEIFAILASRFGLLGAIFAPKCYIILLHPEKNTKKALMGRDTANK